MGAEISAEFYGAVAKVLAFVMSLKSQGLGGRPAPQPDPDAVAAGV